MMEDTNKLEEQMITDINDSCSEEFVEVVGDADEVINEKEDEVK